MVCRPARPQIPFPRLSKESSYNHTRTHTHTNTQAHTHTHTHVTYLYMYMYIYLYIHIHIYIYHLYTYVSPECGRRQLRELCQRFAKVSVGVDLLHTRDLLKLRKKNLQCPSRSTV